jgi:hypothetical protein
VRHLLYGEGYTIRGVQRILREQGVVFVQNVWRAGAEPPPPQTEQDRDEEDISEASSAERTEPDLSALTFPAPQSPGTRGAEHDTQRREPTVASADQAKRPAGLGVEHRRRLRAALDELVACQSLLEAALRGDEPAGGSHTDAAL